MAFQIRSERLLSKRNVLGHFVEQKSLDRVHESSSVGARPSSPAPFEQKSHYFLAGPIERRVELTDGSRSKGAAEDGRTPTEELA